MKKYILLLLISLIFNLNNFSQVALSNSEDATTNANSESYLSFTFDGAWCWFSDPRAVYFEGEFKRTYAGWIDSHGDVVVGYYDHESGDIQTYVLEDQYEIDDHDAPALMFLPSGQLMVFFTKHSSANPTLLFTSKESENITSWDRQELFLNDTEHYNKFENTNTYVNPVLLTEENNRIYLFWRGMDNKPNYSISDNLGKTWSKGRIYILPERIYNMRRPYMKITSNSKDKIMFAFTDGHPRMEKENSIYFMYYKDGYLFNVKNEKIGRLGEKAIEPRQTTVVYDATITKRKAWIWDVAMDEDGNPILTYAKFSNDTSHTYSYSKWDGSKWINSDLMNSGKWFPKTPKNSNEREPNYSGGIVIDHENPNTVYISTNRDSVFEIEQWTFNNDNSWDVKSITKTSTKDNIRPFAVLNAKEENPLQVLWMQNTKYIHYTDYFSSIKMNVLSPVSNDLLKGKNIKSIMRKTADWQLANPYTKASRLDWHWGAFYVGLEAAYDVIKDNKYLNEIKNIGQAANWKLMDDIYHADRLTIADVYTWLYQIEKDPLIIDKAKWAMDIHIGRRTKPDVRFEGNNYKLEWWTWCDALFMAPPSFARMFKATGDTSYLSYADKYWGITSDYLYSEEDSLFFRDDRFFEKKSQNGEKIFWGRGNGWVVAGLARMLNIIPVNHRSRIKYENQFKQMAYKLLSLQRDHGLWTASLYDPDELPIGESSASAFYTYALAWGINNGLLDKNLFEEPVKKAWLALCENVNDNGRLGYVQQVAGDPYPFYEDQWHVYATGAFLLCGKEMIELLDK